jgi:hypothetical protein
MAIVSIFVASAATVAGEKLLTMGSWVEVRDEQTGIMVWTREMTIHPRAEPRPALKYRLIPDDFDMVDGNAAVHYLKAMGFLEQSPAQRRLFDAYDKASKQAQREGTMLSKLPPHSWQTMAPQDLPLDEVKEFLQLTAFQPRSLAEAARRRRFDMSRNIREVENPIGYLIPEVQSMRELARLQTVRCKVAIAEGRIDDAFAIVSQQYSMARHLGQDDFLVTNLVGMAIAGIAWNDALFLAQHPDAPNLYWAFASVPRSVVDVRHALAMERQLLYQQLKILREVDETPRTVGFWQDFLDRLAPELSGFTRQFGLPVNIVDPEDTRNALVAFIAAAYPGAKRYLIEDCGMAPEKVEAYPIAQVVFLGIVRYYEEARDDQFKWNHLPYWQAEAKIPRGGFSASTKARGERAGLITAPAKMLLPAVLAVRTAAARIDQQVALSQAVEAIRMYGAAHDGRLPRTLDDLPVPAPHEPFTGKPLDYRYHGSYAELNGHDMPGLRYRLILRFAKGAK